MSTNVIIKQAALTIRQWNTNCNVQNVNVSSNVVLIKNKIKGWYRNYFQYLER